MTITRMAGCATPGAPSIAIKEPAGNCLSDLVFPRQNAVDGTMRSIAEANCRELKWVQPRAMKRNYELRSGEEVLGRLQWETISGSLANAESADGRWTFKRTGFFNPQITVRAPGSDSNLAVFSPNWKGGGLLTFSDGTRLQWTSDGFWHSRWAFIRETGVRLVEFEPESSFLKTSAVAKVTQEGFSTPAFSLLIFLGWYLMVLRADDDAAGAAAVVVCVAT